VSNNKREQVALQCEAVARLASDLAGVRQDYAKLIRLGLVDDLLDLVGRETARQMEMLGDELNGMDAVGEDRTSLTPVFAEAQRLWPTQEPGT
jgi:hypothetical protein